MKQEFIDSYIFKPFERDESGEVSKTEGNGLGMSITKSILDVMGASLDIESELGKGSVFRIHANLKIDSNVMEDTRDEMTNIPNISGKRLLVVEDNEINMEIILAILERTQAQTTKAWTAEEALELYTQHPSRCGRRCSSDRRASLQGRLF